METFCCSNKCEKRFECARADINNEGTHFVENFYSFGTGTFTNNDCKIEHWCGELGNYKMFEPIRLSEDEFYSLHCCMCGSQRCEGIGTDWFEGCKYKEQLIR